MLTWEVTQLNLSARKCLVTGTLHINSVHKNKNKFPVRRGFLFFQKCELQHVENYT